MSLDMPGRAIPGVFEARQERSARIRDAYVDAGVEMLNETRFGDLRISDLARRCGYSVGGFYSRFRDKEAYFRALRAAAIAACDDEIDRRMAPPVLAAMEPGEALDALVDLMADIFSGRYRGVLRDSLLRILDPEDPWAPMRASARRIMRRLHESLDRRLPPHPPGEARRRISFCFQAVVGVLQNDLVNDHHVFSTRDRSVRPALKEIVRRYMSLDPAA